MSKIWCFRNCHHLDLDTIFWPGSWFPLTAVCDASWRPVTGAVLQEQNAVWVPERADACSCQGAGSCSRVCSWFLFWLCFPIIMSSSKSYSSELTSFKCFFLLEVGHCYHSGSSVPHKSRSLSSTDLKCIVPCALQ